MDNIPLNWTVLAHPANWIIIVLMVWIFVIGMHELNQFANNYETNEA